MTSPSYISAGELYRLGEAQRRLGMGRHSFRLLRQVGLPVLRVGRCHYIEGAAIIGAMKLAAAQQAGDGQRGGEAP